MPVELGKKYKDSITGVEGTAVARTTFLYGCVRVMLENGKDGKAEEMWVDEQRLYSVETQKHVKSNATTGGPGPVPPSRDPR